jgi:hypothetical protein
LTQQHKQTRDEQEQINRMVDEGLGAGQVGKDSGWIEDTKEDEEENQRHQRFQEAKEKDVDTQGRGKYWMDVDRMVNEGLGGGHVGPETGRIEQSIELEEEFSKEGDFDLNQ